MNVNLHENVLHNLKKLILRNFLIKYASYKNSLMNLSNFQEVRIFVLMRQSNNLNRRSLVFIKRLM